MKHIVMLLSLDYLPDLGYYPKIKNEVASLNHHGYKVTLLCWDRYLKSPEIEGNDMFRIRRVFERSRDMRGPSQLWPMVKFSRKAYRVLKVLKPDAIHCHNIDVLPTALIYKRRYGAKVVLDSHEPTYYAHWADKHHFMLPFIHWAERKLVKGTDQITVVNEYQVQKYRSWGNKKIIVVGNYPNDEITVRDIDNEKLSKKECVFGRLGSMYDGVGLEQIVKAFGSVSEKYPQAKLFLAGKVLEGYHDRFEQIIAPIKDKIELVGSFRAEDVLKLYERIDVSILLYNRNKWFEHITPTKFYDTAASAVPMIMTDIGGLGDEIRTRNIGIVVDENDASSIEKAMERFILDNDLRKTMALNCLKLISEKYNWAVNDQRLATAYKELLGE